MKIHLKSNCMGSVEFMRRWYILLLCRYSFSLGSFSFSSFLNPTTCARNREDFFVGIFKFFSHFLLTAIERVSCVTFVRAMQSLSVRNANDMILANCYSELENISNALIKYIFCHTLLFLSHSVSLR